MHFYRVFPHDRNYSRTRNTAVTKVDKSLPLNSHSTGRKTKSKPTHEPTEVSNIDTCNANKPEQWKGLPEWFL